MHKFNIKLGPTARKNLLALIQWRRVYDKGCVSSNVGGWHSNDIRHLAQHEPLGWLLDRITTLSARHLDVKPLMMSNAWIVINEAGDFNKPHDHIPAHWAGVYYVQASEGDLKFVDPNLNLTPHDELLALFPAELRHWVHPHDQETDRIAISFNLVYRDG